ncbi:MAG: hypothetical protein H7274_19025 [Rhodoferax sp.]|nr:hypothetical protein [Rhodoferax sp.]
MTDEGLQVSRSVAELVATDGKQRVRLQPAFGVAASVGVHFLEHAQNASSAGLLKQVRKQMRQLLSDIRAVRKLRRCFHGKSDTRCRDALDVLTQFSGLEPKQLVSQRTVDGLQRGLRRHRIDLDGSN